MKEEENDSLIIDTKELEKLTKMKYQSVIFDSEKDNWKKGSSVFDSKLLKQEKLAFVIETSDGIIIGGYMKKKIMGINRKIGDPDCFLFTNRNNQWKKYPIQPSKKYDSFQLSTKQDNYLFIFGNDIFICKKQRLPFSEGAFFCAFSPDPAAYLQRYSTAFLMFGKNWILLTFSLPKLCLISLLGIFGNNIAKISILW